MVITLGVVTQRPIIPLTKTLVNKMAVRKKWPARILQMRRGDM